VRHLTGVGLDDDASLKGKTTAEAESIFQSFTAGYRHSTATEEELASWRFLPEFQSFRSREVRFFCMARNARGPAGKRAGSLH